MARLLITGSNGLLGTALVKHAALDYEVVGTSASPASSVFQPLQFHQADIRDAGAVQAVMERVQPTAVLHTAAMTNVDACELDPELAYAVNVEGTKHVARAARDVGAKLIAVSSDYVFSGERGPYDEEDAVGPISVYGRTKLEAEEAVRELCKDYCIARTSVLFGWYMGARVNFATWLIETLLAGREVNIVTDQTNAPTLTDSAVSMLLALVEQNVQGVFHTAGGEWLSRYDFARRIAKRFELDTSLIRPVLSADLQQPARRPVHSGLRVDKMDKIAKVTGVRPMGVTEALDALRQRMEDAGR